MSTRSYSNLIVLESLFDSIPTSDSNVLNLATAIFEPHVPIVSIDCGTTLGQIVDVTFEVEGKVELSTGLIISHDRILQLLSHGIYKISIRDISTCIEDGGICQTCYHASRQYDSTPAVNTSIQVFPEYVTFTEAVPVYAGDKVVNISQTTDLYDRIYVYYKGILLSPSTYTVTSVSVTLSSGVSDSGYVVVRYTSLIRAPYLFWLATTYSGSILGIKELPAPALTLRKRLLTSLIPKSMLESVANNVQNLTGIPPEPVEYLTNIIDPLEKALFVIALYAVFLNVN